MHQGSKYSVLDPQENDTEDGMVSLRNNIFYSVCQRNICYEMCNSLTFSAQEYSMINISPQNNCSLEQLIEQNMSQILNKKCMVCHRNTKHTDSHIWVSPPQSLVLFINRLVYMRGRSVKQHIPIAVQPVVEMQQYRFRLLGIIDHLGCSANSGHYTSTLFRNDSSFHCNDQVITESAGVTGGFSSTVYMMFYVLSS